MNHRASWDLRASSIGTHLACRCATGRSRHAVVGVVAATLMAGCAAVEPVTRGPGSDDPGVVRDVVDEQHTPQRASPGDPGRDEAAGEPWTDSIPRMVVVPFPEARFVPVRPDLAESPEIAVLWGDPARGPSAMFMRLRSGSIPMHVHSSDYHLVVLEGTMKHWDPGDSEETAPPLGPRSYWFQPGELPHAEACLTETCLLYVVWAGPQDARLVQ